MEKKNYNVYNHSSLKSAEILEVKKIIYINSNITEEIEKTLNTDYEKELKDLKEKEYILFNELKSKSENWEDIAYRIKTIEETKKYNELNKFIQDIETTNNEYVKSEAWRSEEERISNKVYNLYFRIYRNTTYQNKEEKFLSYEVSYYFSINSIGYKEEPRVTKTTIKSVEKKKCFNDEELKKYITGRKKYFSKYFKELFPPVEKEYINNLSYRGKLIKGYEVEEE